MNGRLWNLFWFGLSCWCIGTYCGESSWPWWAWGNVIGVLAFGFHLIRDLKNIAVRA